MTTPHSAARPLPGEHAPYYSTYINLVPDGDVVATMRGQHHITLALLRRLSDAQAGWRPAAAEWSIKQVVGHLIDAERLFAFRAVWFARGDSGEQPGMDQNAWMQHVDFDARDWDDLLAEWAECRACNARAFAAFTAADWVRGGIASGNPSTVRTWVWALTGHELHHRASLETVYRAAWR